MANMLTTLTTQAERDLAYNSSLAISNSAEITQSWVVKSQAARDHLKGDLNVAYGPGARQCFDYYSAGNDSPIVVFVHGGFWQMRSKDDFLFLVPTLLEQGISVAMLGYTLAPEASMGDIVNDIRMGLDAIEAKVRHDRKSQPTAGVSTQPKRAIETFPGFCLLGWSAGAQLVAATIDQPNVNSAVCVSGIYDLEPMRHCYVNEKLKLDANSAERYSPIKQINHFGKTINFFVGGAELPAMQAQTNDFYAYRQAHNQAGQYTLLESLNHYTVFDAFVNPDGAVLAAIKNLTMSIKSYIRTVPHYPHQGIMFRDITTLLKDPAGLRLTVDGLANRYKDTKIDKVVGIESRGFILGAPLAYALGVGFVPIRKKGKLPAETIGHDYELEYGVDRIELHIDAITEGENILLVDDLIATGGTAQAAVILIEKMGGDIVECCFAIDLPDIGGHQRLLDMGQKVFALCEFEGD
jgi:adenine phosphoribosyltransferase